MGRKLTMTLIALAAISGGMIPPSAVADPVMSSGNHLVASKIIKEESIGDKIIKEAEKYLGTPYVFGGRLTSKHPGLDCQGIILLPYSKLFGFNWTKVPVWNNRKVVDSGYLGHPVKGLDGVLAEDIDFDLFKPGDAIYFLDENFSNKDTPLLVENGREHLTWHTGLYKGGPDHLILHAAPGDKVLIEAIDEVYFDALFVTRRSL
jgi:cell wall-associated NlpC family hydrolase